MNHVPDMIFQHLKLTLASGFAFVLLLSVKNGSASSFPHSEESLVHRLSEGGASKPRVPAGNPPPHTYMKYLQHEMDNGRIPSANVLSYRANPGWPTCLFHFSIRSEEMTNIQLALPTCYKPRTDISVNGEKVMLRRVNTLPPKSRSFFVLDISHIAQRFINVTSSSIDFDMTGLEYDDKCLQNNSTEKWTEAPLLVTSTLLGDTGSNNYDDDENNNNSDNNNSDNSKSYSNDDDNNTDNNIKTPPSASHYRYKRGFPDSIPRSDSVLDSAARATACKLHPWYVRLSELKWDKVILMPEGYLANYCAGSCSAPFLPGDSINGSNHAFMKGMYQIATSAHDERVTSHCVPVSYGYISVLYYDSDDNLVIKRIPEMKVKECGCL